MHWKDYDWEKAEAEEKVEKKDYRWLIELDHREKQWRRDRKTYIQRLKNTENPDDSLFVDELYGWQYEK